MSLAKGAPTSRSEAGLGSPGVGGWWPSPQLVDLHLHPLHLCQELLLVGGVGGIRLESTPSLRNSPSWPG